MTEKDRREDYVQRHGIIPDPVPYDRAGYDVSNRAATIALKSFNLKHLNLRRIIYRRRVRRRRRSEFVANRKAELSALGESPQKHRIRRDHRTDSTRDLPKIFPKY